MRAIVIEKPGGPEVLTMREVDDPLPGKGEVRVRVRATAVNRADLLQRRGAYPAPPDSPADIPGLEFAGEVESLGPGHHEVAVGDRVMGIAGGGAYAELLVVPSRTLVRMPSGMAFVEAAAIPEAFITAFDALVLQGGLRAGDDALVSAVGSGVGTAAVQIIRALGARSLGTARTAAKLERAQADLGLDAFVLAADGRFADGVLAETGGRGVDLVLELVGGAYVAEDLACTAPLGRIVLVGLMAGARADVDLGLVLRKRLTLRGTVLRSRPIEEKIAVSRAFGQQMLPLFARGALRPIVGSVMSFTRAGEAHALAEKNETFGKLVLSV